MDVECGADAMAARQMGDTIVTILADVAAFWSYENRERLRQSKEADEDEEEEEQEEEEEEEKERGGGSAHW
jgi:ribosomal protein L12E/L44/L45/RPP1/RPP2